MGGIVAAGVGVQAGVGLRVAVLVGVGVGVVVAVGDGLGDGVDDGLAVAVALGDGLGVTVGDRLAVAVGVGLLVSVGWGVAVGVGVAAVQAASSRISKMAGSQPFLGMGCITFLLNDVSTLSSSIAIHKRNGPRQVYHRLSGHDSSTQVRKLKPGDKRATAP